ncbi:hypothetical protein AB0O01_02620 [Streptomyces sp. NPDC093252]|uniref:hypothetical protein n=1 Tax=Streptomyces sp. NPDC093252 TaxID=3154980 RepID=UPI00342624C2
MTTHHTFHRRPRLRLAAALAVPLFAFSAACGAGDDGAGGEPIASAPGEPAGGGGGRTSAPSSPPAADKGAFYDAQMTYVECMRTKGGVKDFPDPRLSGYLDWAKIDEVADPDGRGEEYKGGKDAVCFPELSEAMALEPPRDPQRDFESMLAHAKCMRDNGVSRFTNPTMSGGGVIPGGDPSPGSPVIDPDSPAYREARAACKDELLEGLDGMQ